MEIHYSKKETNLIKAFKCDHLLDFGMDPVNIYEIMMKKAFRENISGPHVESLRRCINALHDCKIYRETPEWDEMIELLNPLEDFNNKELIEMTVNLPPGLYTPSVFGPMILDSFFIKRDPRNSEPTITINGILLNTPQAMTVRVAITNFTTNLKEPDALGDDETGTD